MASLDWTVDAQGDLESIKAYIARESPDYAPIFVAKLRDAAERLRAFPRSGRTVPEFDLEDLREIVLDNYRIVYVLGEERVLIIAVAHGRQELG